MLVSEVLARTVPDGVPNDAVAVVDAFAVGEFYVRSSAIGPGELPLVIGAGAIGLSDGGGPHGAGRRAGRRFGLQRRPAGVCQEFGADVLVNAANADRSRCGEKFGQRNSDTQVIFECVGAPACAEHRRIVRVPGAGVRCGWVVDAETIDCTAATHKGSPFSSAAARCRQDWYGTLDAVVEGSLDPLPSIGK